MELKLAIRNAVPWELDVHDTHSQQCKGVVLLNETPARRATRVAYIALRQRERTRQVKAGNAVGAEYPVGQRFKIFEFTVTSKEDLAALKDASPNEARTSAAVFAAFPFSTIGGIIGSGIESVPSLRRLGMQQGDRLVWPAKMSADTTRNDLVDDRDIAMVQGNDIAGHRAWVPATGVST